MDNPEWRAQQGDVLYQNALALVEVDELWTHAVLLGEATFVHRYAVFCPFEQTGTGTVALCCHSLLPAKLGCTAHRPPCLTGAATVDSALTCNGNVVLLVRINLWR